MPNWVSIGFTAIGDPAEVRRLRNRMIRTVTAPADGFFGLEGEIIDVFDFGRIIPMPDDAAANNYGEWAIQHWGVKWNAQYLSFDEPSPGRLMFHFDTAWGFPLQVFEALATEFPTLVFEGYAHEESGLFSYAGQFNGADDFGPVEPDDNCEDESDDLDDGADEG